MAYPIPIQVSVNLRSKDFPPYEFPPRVFPSSDLWSSVLRAHGLPREVLHPGHYYIKKCRGNGPTASVSDTVEKIRTQYAKTDANNICVRVVRNETFRSPAPLSGRFSMRSPPRRSRRRAQFYPPAQVIPLGPPPPNRGVPPVHTGRMGRGVQPPGVPQDISDPPVINLDVDTEDDDDNSQFGDEGRNDEAEEIKASVLAQAQFLQAKEQWKRYGIDKKSLLDRSSPKVKLILEQMLI
ncbi:uncharacterized protein LOC110860898 isoform X2 [Folsomia candida]|uniref:uncharacterized protein LOC110860898 isoform X2 n=1 Tax=Folsomia candida TaxID=158441 RepID=UPI000B8F4957|nr:uncharacterized protein LOC110860898 isoform X2 [Folsomia candida]